MKTSKFLTYSFFLAAAMGLAPRIGLALLLAALGGYALPLHAAPSWSTIYSDKYSKDTSPSTANREKYTAYYCTVEAANSMFKASTLDGIENYLKANFATGKSAMGTTAGSYELTQGGYIEELAQYQFISYFADEIAAGNYFAVAFYGSDAFRVFASADVDSGNLVFDDTSTSAAQSVGDWTTPEQTPEPTSGLLMLLGLAGLALKRKQRK